MEKNLQIVLNLLNNQELLGKESLTINEVKEIINNVDKITITDSKKDFATKEQREVFNDIMSKVTCLKKLDEYTDSIFYIINDSVYMEQDLKTDNFYIRYGDFWEVFETKFDLNYEEIKELLRGLLEERLICKVNTTEVIYSIFFV